MVGGAAAAVVPWLAALGLLGAVLLYALIFWDRAVDFLAVRTKRFQDDSELAGISFKPREFGVMMVVGATLTWVAVVILLKPPMVVDIVLFPCLVAFAFSIVGWRIRKTLDKRRTLFLDQLESILRLMSGALRGGLGLQQAMVNIVGDLPSPAHEEIVRVIGQSSIGISVYDSIDEVAARMPSNKMLIAAKTIRTQSQTGGDLAKILDKLANTIRERRKLMLKVRTLTSEGKASAWIVGILTPAMGGIILSINHDMVHTLFQTSGGLVFVTISATLEVLCIFVCSKILAFKF